MDDSIFSVESAHQKLSFDIYIYIYIYYILYIYTVSYALLVLTHRYVQL